MSNFDDRAVVASRLVERLATEHFGSLIHFDEERMVAAVVGRGFTEQEAHAAIVEVTTRHLRGVAPTDRLTV